MSRVSTKPQDKRVKTKSSDGSLLLMNPNASCYEESVHTDKQLTIAEAETKDHTAVKSKNRSKSPSFFKLLVGGLRKLSSQEFGDSLPTTSLSDNEEITFTSPHRECIDFDDRQHSMIGHFATLPREREEWTRTRSELVLKMSSPEDNHKYEGSPVETSPDSIDQTQMNIPMDQTIPDQEYHSFGLDALETLHNQLQILMRQDCDEEMPDTIENKVIESLHNQISDLQQSLECIQQSDQSLRVALKMAEIRAQDAEIKLHHSTDRCLKLERDCRWMETEFKILYQKYHEMQRHLQKKAVLHQMSPNKSRRSNLAGLRQRSYDTMGPIKRHNSSEYKHHQQHNHLNLDLNGPSPTRMNISPMNTLPPRLHSGSLSHTETRV